jgi:hypothetical protein
MSAVDVELDIETLWEQDSFSAFLTPLRSGEVVYPEKEGVMAVHHGRAIIHASWKASGPTVVDGAKIRVGDRVRIKECERMHVDAGDTLVLVAEINELP